MFSRENNDSYPGLGLWRPSNPGLPFPAAARLLIFTVIGGLLSLRAAIWLQGWREGDGTKVSQSTLKFTVLTKI